jgi:hypothetical protein
VVQATTKLFIDGKPVESKAKEWIDVINPVRVSPRVSSLGVLNCPRMMGKLKQTFLRDTWKTRPLYFLAELV